MTAKYKVSKKDISFLLENPWVELEDLSNLKSSGPIHDGIFDNDEDPPYKLLRMIRNPDYFSFTCKHLLNINLLPFQAVILKELWIRPFPMLLGSRGLGKSFLLGTYAMLRALLDQGSKIIICGSGFRQAKLVFQYAENIWNNSPILRDICKGEHKNGVARDQDQWSIRVGKSVIFGIPMGDGSKIRGFRATDIIMDEFASVNPEIYQNVIQGFAAVSADPVENVKKLARNKIIKKYELDLETDNYIKPNRQILSGTAYYEFNHFATYWKKWKSIVESRGDPKKLSSLFPEGTEEGFDWRDYSIIRIPVGLIPEGYMDAKAVGKAKASSHLGNYMLEYGAVFVSDTNGFFKRSLIESCVAKDDNIKPPIGPIQFSAQLNGNVKNNYIIAIDPASESDNCAIIVLELRENHKRIVYCWTTTKQRYLEIHKKQLTKEHDFYVFVAKKIRELRYKFPAARIAMDEEGGGRAIAEALRDPKNLDDISHQLILPIIEEDVEKPTDNVPGEHILELINFSRYDWYSEAHHTLRKDLEDKTLLFPFYDSVSIGLAGIQDELLERGYDTLEECTTEIEELKDELATITIQKTPTGRDRWDVPETKLPGGKKGKQRKDRFTALLIANMAARGVQMKYIQPTHNFIGGFAHTFKESTSSGPLFTGPLWYQEEMRKGGY